MKVYIHTFGCKVNSFESAAMSETLAKSGFEILDNSAGADVVVVNSCTVTANGDRKVAQFVRSVKRGAPDTVVVLSGCMPQAYPQKAEAMAGVDIITGTGNRLGIAELINTYMACKYKTVSVLSGKKDFEPLGVERMDGHTRAFMKIEDGCDRYCAYCIIPYARGNVRYMSLEDIKAQADSYAKKGYREIVLSGINLSFYGRGSEIALYDAVQCAAAPDGIERVRLGSLEPDLLPNELLTRLSSIEKLCGHFHLSLQSGCDATLSDMRRRYDTAQFAAVADRIRTLFPQPTFTTDVIVGFPGETEEHLAQSLRFVQSFGFLKVHVFPYSARPGTAAADFPNQVPNPKKKRRAALMTGAADSVREKVMRQYIGRTARVIAEQPAGGGFEGYTDHYLPALIIREGVATGDIVNGMIQDIRDGKCIIV